MSRKVGTVTIPPELLADVDPRTGVFRNDKTLRGLFMCPPNVDYLVKFVLYKFSRAGPPDISVGKIPIYSALYAKYQHQIAAIVRSSVPNEAMPYAEQRKTEDLVALLDKKNREFIEQTYRMLINSPDSIDPDFYMYDDETGEVDRRGENTYDVSSYSDGTWHPEHLFTNKQRNRDTGYWQAPHDFFDPNPEATGVGHRYNSPLYALEGRQTQFLPSQYTVYRRHYDREAFPQGLKDGGNSERRTQVPKGYNMRSLREYSTD